MLNFALWEDTTIINSSIGASPFQVIYGQEEIMLAELELLSLCLIVHAEELTPNNIP